MQLMAKPLRKPKFGSLKGRAQQIRHPTDEHDRIP